jgi:hydroxylysine kinase
VAAVPRITSEQAEEIALEHYGIRASAERLPAEHDDTFRLSTRGGAARLLKVGVADETAAAVSFQTAILLHLAATAPELPVQRVVRASDGTPEVRIPGGEGSPPRLVRVTSWLDGKPLGTGGTGTGLRRDIGATLARLNTALRGLRHPGARRTHLWDLQNLPRLRTLLGELPRSGILPEVSRALGESPAAAAGWLRPALEECLSRFDAVVRPALAATRTQVIHADFHGDNLLADGHRITGILDFGDALTGPVAMDVGTAACYQLGSPPRVFAPALDVVAGYHAIAALRLRT